MSLMGTIHNQHSNDKIVFLRITMLNKTIFAFFLSLKVQQIIDTLIPILQIRIFPQMSSQAGTRISRSMPNLQQVVRKRIFAVTLTNVQKHPGQFPLSMHPLIFGFVNNQKNNHRRK